MDDSTNLHEEKEHAAQLQLGHPSAPSCGYLLPFPIFASRPTLLILLLLFYLLVAGSCLKLTYINTKLFKHLFALSIKNVQMYYISPHFYVLHCVHPVQGYIMDGGCKLGIMAQGGGPDWIIKQWM